MQVTTNLGLKVWNLTSDTWNPQDLVDNWNALETDYSRARTSNKAETLAAIPGAGNFQGRLVYLTADNSGFKANSLIRYDGSTWQVVGPAPERHASLPTVNNYQGRVIVLTAGAGGFAVSDVLVNTDGANAWKKVGGIGTGSSLPGSPVAGDMFLLTAASGGFEAYSLVAYNGSTWNRTEKRGIELGTSLPGTPFAGQVFILTTAAGGFNAYDIVRWNGSSWGLVNLQLGSTATTALAGNAAVATPVTASMFSGTRINGQTYTITAPVAGTYVLEWGAGTSFGDSQGDSGTITNNVTAGAATFGDVSPSGGPQLRTGVVLTAGQVITFTCTGSSGWGVTDPWAKLTRIA